VAEEVLKEPGDDSLRQVERVMVDKEYRDMMSERVAKASETVLAVPLPSTPNLQDETKKQALDSRIDKVEDFVSVGRSKLKDIDALLSTGSN